MQLKIQKRLAAEVLNTVQSKIWLDSTRLDEIKEAITKNDVKSLIKDKAIVAQKPNHISRSRARKTAQQKSKGKQKGPGSKKGTSTSRVTKKRRWINHIRIQRDFLKNLRDKEVIETSAYRTLYLKSKGGFFRSKRHLKMYMIENGILKNENNK